MRQFVAVLGIMVVLAAVAASSAMAVPSDVKVRVEGRVELVSPTVVRLTVAYDCPVGRDTNLTAGVSQPETGAFATTFVEIPLICTDRWETIVLTMGPPSPGTAPFALGAADAGVIITAGGGFRERSVHIFA